jgi:hypothetical protein
MCGMTFCSVSCRLPRMTCMRARCHYGVRGFAAVTVPVVARHRQRAALIFVQRPAMRTPLLRFFVQARVGMCGRFLVLSRV